MLSFNMNKQKLVSFIQKRKHLIWWVKDYQKLSPALIVEATLNYGNWEDVQELIKILGIKKTAKIFWGNSKPSPIGRQNYNKKTKHYFNLYFSKYAK